MVRFETLRQLQGRVSEATYGARLLAGWRWVSGREVADHVERRIREVTRTAPEREPEKKTGGSVVEEVVGRIPGLRKLLRRGEPPYVKVGRLSNNGSIEVNGNGLKPHGEVFTSTGISDFTPEQIGHL